jgi:hypothetical protein
MMDFGCGTDHHFDYFVTLNWFESWRITMTQKWEYVGIWRWQGKFWFEEVAIGGTGIE